MPEGCLRVVETKVNCTLNRPLAILCKYAMRTYGFLSVSRREWLRET